MGEIKPHVRRAGDTSGSSALTTCQQCEIIQDELTYCTSSTLICSSIHHLLGAPAGLYSNFSLLLFIILSAYIWQETPPWSGPIKSSEPKASTPLTYSHRKPITNHRFSLSVRLAAHIQHGFQLPVLMQTPSCVQIHITACSSHPRHTAAVKCCLLCSVIFCNASE